MAIDRRQGRHPSLFVLPGEWTARHDDVEAPAGDRRGTLARRSQPPQPGRGRVGSSGSEATGWHHYDGAREIGRERSRGKRSEENRQMLSASQGGFYLDKRETAGSPVYFGLAGASAG